MSDQTIVKEKNAPLFELAVATMVAVTSDKWLGMRAILALLVSTCLASAQEGPITSRHGVGHDSWHTQFYSKLVKTMAVLVVTLMIAAHP